MSSNLIDGFLELRRKQLKGINADVLFYINKSLGTSYQHGRLKEWSTGKRKPNAEVVEYMTAFILEDKLEKLGIDNKKVKEIINSCSLPSAIENKE